MKRLIILIILAVLALPAVAALTNTIPLLALTEENGKQGGIAAELHLETRPGTGRVFLDTFPLTKIGTQISMRFAQQVSCKELNLDCSTQDFIYAIQGSPGLVGGPSAGASAAVLTAATLKRLSLKNTVAMTGTINSGGLIGAVGGLKFKIDAAADKGFTKVLIPKGTRNFTEENNTIDLVEHGKSKSVEVIEVSTLQEALFHFTGKKLHSADQELLPDPTYLAVIQQTAADICDRGIDYQEQLSSRILNQEAQKIVDNAVNITAESKTLFDQEKYYSAASFCFRTNIQYKRALYINQELTIDEAWNELSRLQHAQAQQYKIAKARNIKTITDLQAYTITLERLREAAELLVESRTLLLDKNLNATITQLAFAEERMFSAQSWANFFGTPGKTFTLDDQTLRQGCTNKISEAEERYNYLVSLRPIGIPNIREGINRAFNDYEKERFASCLFEASKSKAEIDMLLSTLGVKNLEDITDIKLNGAKNSLIVSQKKGIFPILAYSYFEYAQTLVKDDPGSALLFAEYALEMSNTDIYFEDRKGSFVEINETIFITFFVGVILGMILLLAYQSKKR
jgi:uncharacterized protein